MGSTTIGVLGAGVMGCDVALDLVLHQFSVVLYDNSAAQLDSARNKIRQQYRLYKMMNPAAHLSSEELFRSIVFTPDLLALRDAALIVENITENWEAKKALYRHLDEVAGETTVIAANTSCIPISKLAALVKFPGNVIGTHFMNPVPFKKFVEVIRGKCTSEETLKTTLSLLKALGKKTVVVNDSPGFVSNRVLMLTINESIRTVEEGIATPADVDRIFQLGFSHAMGPLATADLIGLDTIMHSLAVLHDELTDPKYIPCALLVSMVEAGSLGKKSGKGFYTY